MPIKKNQLAQRLGEKLGVTKKQAGDFVDAFTEEITSLMRKGEKVNITGFGIFKVVDRKARMGINPKTGEKISIPASKKPKFTAGKALKEAVK